MVGGFDVISIGDMGIDVFLEMDPKEVVVSGKDNSPDRTLTFKFGDKIPVKKMSKTIAGNASNVAVGSRRLTSKTALVTIIGHDDEADMIVDGLRKEKIDLRFMKQDKRTNFSAVINVGAERTIFVYHEPRDYKLPKLPRAKFAYLTSMRSGWEVLISPLSEYLDKSGTKLAFNPGTYQLRAGAKVSQQLLDRCEILFVNKEEAALYLGLDKPGKFHDMLLALHKHGPKFVVITDGPNGSYASDATGQYQIGIADVPVIERTGCGDAYATGFMNAILTGHDIQEAMRWGTFNAAGNIQSVGPQAGLLTLTEMLKYSRKYARVVATSLPATK